MQAHLYSKKTSRVASCLLSALLLLGSSFGAMAASLSGSSSSSTSTVNLTSVGTLDWAHWGDGVPGLVRKTGTSIISSYTVIGGATVTANTTDTRRMGWSNGTPTASGSSNKNGVSVSGAGYGFQLTVPADAQARTVKVYVSGSNSSGTFTAHLSDGSAPDYTNTTSLTGGTFDRTYTVNYTAGSSGKQLVIKWVQAAGAGNIVLNDVSIPTFTYVNHAPTVSLPSSLTTGVGQAVYVAASGFDSDGDALTYSATGIPPGLTLAPSTGVISGTPTTTGTYTVSVTVRDPSALAGSASTTWTIGAGTNTAPSSASASFTAGLNASATVTPTWFDPDAGDTWTLSVVTQPAHGSVSISGQQFTYTPATDYVGADSFTFRVTDNHGASTTGTAGGTVSAVTPDQVTGLVGTQGTIVGAVNLTWSAAGYAQNYDVYRGVSSSDPAPVFLQNVTATAYSDTSASAGVTYYYSVQAANAGGTGPRSVAAPAFADTPPTGAAATFSAALETPLTVTPTWTDPDSGDTGTLVVTSQPAHGTAVVSGQAFTYTPSTAYVGPDSFTFSVTDRAGGAVSGTATGTVTAADPVPVSTVSATQGTLAGSVQVAWTGTANSRSYNVLRGLSSSDPSPTTLANVSGTSYSDLTAAVGTQYFYSIQAATFGKTATSSSSVLGYVDTPPSAAAATFAATLETPVAVTPTWTDPDSGDTGTIVVTSQPAHGTAVVAGQNITYTPAAAYAGADSFTFTVTDRAGATIVGTANGTVTALDPVPVSVVTATQGTLLGSVQVSWTGTANSRSYNVLRGLSSSDPAPVLLGNVAVTSFSDPTAAAGTQYYYSIQAATIGKTAAASSTVLGYADTAPTAASATFSAILETPVAVTPTWTDPNSGDTGTIVVTSQPAHGTAVVAGQNVTYTPAAGYVGGDSFTFTVTDRAGASVSGIATGTVTALDPVPVSAVSASQGTLVGSVQVSWTGTANSRSYNVFRGASSSDPAPTLLSNVSGTSFSDAAAAAGTQYFYSIQAATVGKTATVSSSVLGYADTPPSSASASFAATLETPISVTPTWTDPDSGDSGTIVVTSQPAHGTAVVAGQSITYTPAAGYVGGDGFAFTVTDRAGASVSGTASGTVTALDPAPVSTVSATQGTLVGSVQIAWTGTINSRSYNVLRGTSSSDPSPTNVANVSGTSFSDLTAAVGTQYYYSVQAATVGKTASPSSSVLGYADTPPSSAAATFAATLETPITITPTWTDPDSGDVGSIVVSAQPAHGTAVVAGQSITYTPAAGYAGGDSFGFTVTDRAGASTSGTATGTVTALDPSPVATVSATQGTLLSSVDVTWSAAANARTYIVKRGTSSSDPAPVDVATVSSTSYSDVSASPGVQYYYAIQSATVGKTGPVSSSVLGFADTAPTGASGSFTTNFGTPVVISPAFTDPDPGESIAISLVTPPAHGSATVVGSNIRYTPSPLSYVGPDSFTFRVTDRAGASTVGTVTGTVVAAPPDPISGLTASQGTSLGTVNISWNTSAFSLSYAIYRGVSSSDPAPTQISSVSGLSFTDSTATPGQSYYYFVKPSNPALDGPMSVGVLGFSDTPPASAAGTFSTLQNQSVTFVPTWVDTDPGDVFVLAIVSPPSHGVVSVVNNQFVFTPSTGYIGSDQFQFSITDRAGASVTGLASGTVAPGVPDAPLGFVVSQGTTLGSVELAWATTIGSNQYLVLRSEVASDANPDTIATVSVNSFSDHNATPGVQYYYRIKGVGVAGVGPFSREVSGYADTPPSAASAATTTVFNTPVQFSPAVTDPDPGESFTLTLTSQPANGVATLTSDSKKFIYTPNTGYAGTDNFTFTAADIAGASISGSARVGVGCPAPTVSSLTLSQPKIFAGSGFTVAGSYGNTGCPGTLSADFTVKSGSTVVYAAPTVPLAGAVSAPLAFTVDSLQAGSYVLDVAVSDSVTGNIAHASIPLNVSSYRMPTFSASSKVFANLDIATIAIGSSPDCTLTEVRSAAIANHSLCYFEVVPQPPGLVRDTAQTLPTWSGKVTVAGQYNPQFAVYQYDDLGTPKVLGTVNRSMDVQPLDSMQFVSPASVQVSQFIGEATINVNQTAGSVCQITTDRTNAITGTARGTRMCFLEFTPAPQYSTLGATGVTAPFLAAGTATVNWQMSTFDVSGNQLPFATGNTVVNVVPPDITFDATTGTNSPIATVTRAAVSLTSTGTDRCTLTVDPTKAQVPGIDKPCLVEWTSIPPGLSQDATTAIPSLVGVFTAAGAQGIGFDVVYYDVSGARQVLLSATKPVQVDLPPLPVVVLKLDHEIAPGLLTAPVTGGNLATLVLDVTKWPMDALVTWSDQAFSQTYRISPTRGSQILPATEAPLWTKRQVTIRLFLRSAPDLFVEKTYDVISVPVDGIKFSLDNLDTTAADSVPVPVTARVDMSTRNGPVYDAGTMGQWQVQFGFRDSSGGFVPQGSPVLTDSNGVATSSVNVFGMTIARVMAKATSVSPQPEYVRTMETPPKVTTVVKGTAINGSIVVKGQSQGPAPLVAILRVAFDTRSDQLANESVNWSISSDAGTTWAPMGAPGLQVIQRLGEGRYLVKATFVNRNTQLSSETAPVPLAVWAVPKIVVSGNTFEFPGAQAALTATLTQPSGIPVVSSAVEWSVSKRVVVSAGSTAPPPVATGTTTDIRFVAQDPGQYMLTVRARMLSSDPADPRAWGTSLTQITYGAPEKPTARITGPARAEVGKPYTFDLSLRTRYSLTNTSLSLGGSWTLPDGTTVPSLAGVTYTPTDADLSAGTVITLKYQAWVNGYEDTTTATATVTVPIWKYQWPEWRVVPSVVSQYAPTNVRLSVLPSNLALLPTLDGLTYTWTVPASARVLSAPGVRLDAVIDFGGDVPFSVTMSDARGNSTTVDSTVTVQNPKAYAVDLAINNMSKWSHAPLSLGVTPKVTGGHPLDAITTWQYSLDGVPLNLANKNTAIMAVDQPGDHTVTVVVTSKMGATATKTATVSVPANQAPTCTVSATPGSDRRFVPILAHCVDPDGAITKYMWSINGVPQPFSNGAKWTYIMQAGVTYPLQIDLVVTDDGGLTANASTTAR